MTPEKFLAQYGTFYPSAMYGDAHPSGARVLLYPTSHLQTHDRRVEFPEGERWGVLFPRLTVVGGFRFGGQCHDGGNLNAEWSPAGWTPLPTNFQGMSPILYDLAGRRWMNGVDEFVGAGGYRYAFPDGTPGGRRVSADATVGLDGSELSEVSPLGFDGRLWIGQGHPDAAKNHAWIWDRGTGKHRLLVEAPCWFIRVQIDGAMAAVTLPLIAGGVWIIIAPIAAFYDLDTGTMPGAPLPFPIGPLTPPRSDDGRTYDLASFILGDAGTWPRSGPTHPMHQVVDPGGLFYYVKFGDVVPSGEAYEMWGYDEHWIYHLEDASGHHSGPYSFLDPRWYPRRMAIGEAHAFDTGPHETVFRNRGTCEPVGREPWRRRMWLEAVYDRFYWGPDLGERATIVIAFDPTAGIHSPGRDIELGYYAHGAGSVRWESYHSEKVYPKGATRAQFTDAARWTRSDFYLKGGPALRPKLTGCVAQVCPHLPPLPTTNPTPPTFPAPTPVPVPVPKEDEMVAYGTPMLGFQTGDTKDNGDGTVSVQKPNGKWLCITPDGATEERDNPGGPWESFKRTSTSLVAIRGDRTFVLPLVNLE